MDETLPVNSVESPRNLGNAGKGRVKGVPNNVTRTARENIIAVFTRLGGTGAMARWARRNQTEFYRLYARLIPVQVAGDPANPILLKAAGDLSKLSDEELETLARQVESKMPMSRPALPAPASSDE